ncbi:helix-turn-helix domain-containing protein [Saccharothrix sp.]|uniref:nSTAND1 domain-containing NTPase n=1 Tax=Saccharothrix sp. TaxID=1873460 RepID=UPI002811E2B6|nr:helix-turn-helix domain-containing protein [Saccharothrix sp.]
MPRGERPLDAGDSPLLKFAADLRSLRDKAGGYSYRQLGARAHYSATTLSDAAGGRKLPTLAVTLAYVRACEGDVAEWEDRWHRVAAEVLPTPQPAAGEGHPPYAGLAAYGTEDAEWFFGREHVLEDLESRIATRRFVAVFGASGAGKSSLLRAGLVPRRTDRTTVTTPSQCDFTAGDLDHDLLIVDQFEEIFTLCPDPDQRESFIDALLTAECQVVVGVRADFYGHCAQYPDLVKAITDGQLLLGPMGPEELRQVIMQPAIKANCTVETALVSRLIADATGQAGVLPLLSHALLETWRRRRGTTLTLAGYEAAGGIQHAIAQTAERTFTSLERQQRVLARQVFLRLTALGDGTEDTKRRLPRAELDHDVDVDVVLDRLAHARLLTLDRDTVEISHEALIRSWPRLRNWLSTDRDGLRTMRRLTEAAATWDALDRDPDALYRGSRLDTALEWTSRDGVRTSVTERDFLKASQDARDEERKRDHRQTRRLRQLVALLLVLLLFAGSAVVLAIRAQKQAAQERNLSVARLVANEAQSKRATDRRLANHLIIAAYQLSRTDDLRDQVLSFHAATSRDMVSRSVYPTGTTGPDGTALPNARVPFPADDHVYKRLGGYLTPRNTVTSVAVTPGQQAFATTAESPDARIWDITDARNPVLAHTFTEPLIHAVLSPNGQTLVTVESPALIRIWDASNPYEPVLRSTITRHDRAVNAIAFSPDKGDTLITIDNQSTVRLFDIADPSAPHQIGKLDDGQDVTTAAITQDGSTLAVAGRSGTIRLWDLRANPWDPTRLSTLDAHQDRVTTLGFRRDGTALASVGKDSTVRMWDLASKQSPTQRGRISGNTDNIYAVSFGDAPDWVTTANSDGTTRSWEFNLDLAIANMCETAGQPLTPEEWRRNFNGIAYHPPCS